MMTPVLSSTASFLPVEASSGFTEIESADCSFHQFMTAHRQSSEEITDPSSLEDTDPSPLSSSEKKTPESPSSSSESPLLSSLFFLQQTNVSFQSDRSTPAQDESSSLSSASSLPGHSLSLADSPSPASPLQRSSSDSFSTPSAPFTPPLTESLDQASTPSALKPSLLTVSEPSSFDPRLSAFLTPSPLPSSSISPPLNPLSSIDSPLPPVPSQSDPDSLTPLDALRFYSSTALQPMPPHSSLMPSSKRAGTDATVQVDSLGRRSSSSLSSSNTLSDAPLLIESILGHHRSPSLDSFSSDPPLLLATSTHLETTPSLPSPLNLPVFLTTSDSSSTSAFPSIPSAGLPAPGTAMFLSIENAQRFTETVAQFISKTLPQGPTSAVLNLHPESLGSVQAHLSWDRSESLSALSLTLSFSNLKALEMAQSHSLALYEALTQSHHTFQEVRLSMNTLPSAPPAFLGDPSSSFSSFNQSSQQSSQQSSLYSSRVQNDPRSYPQHSSGLGLDPVPTRPSSVLFDQRA